MLGPRRWRPLALPAVALMVLAGACDGSTRESSDAKPGADAVPSLSGDEAVVQQHWEAYWQERIASENAAELTPEFTRITRGKALEMQTRRVRNYQRHDLVRVGRPEFGPADVRVNGGSATVLACLDADRWTALVGGEPRTARKYGWELTGSVLRQVDGTWVVVDEMTSEDVADMGTTC